MKTKNLVELSNNVWMYPYSHQGIQPNIGVIITEEGTILVDSGNSPIHAENIKQALNGIDAPPVKYVIYTHHHWDHTYGGSMFNSIMISHELCYEQLKINSELKWSTEILEEEIRREPLLETRNKRKMELINDWDSFEIKLPNITFKDRMMLHLGSTSLELKFIGGIHASDSILVKDLKSNILFVGDCFYPPPIHLRKKEDTHSLDILKKLVAEEADLYIHGHGEPADRKELEDFIYQNEKKHL
ncbi:MBL fold metallo-hydrolase [Pseudalkalibacillus sp. SCS-8]|uniref:MBL fold metallo-hydrolase n=1 Tax=Pseudalkalibacillus nanhaiensis TaxID=3115291 RepID=UPI0032DA6816